MILITRPVEDGQKLASFLLEKGVPSFCEPLLDVRWQAGDFSNFEKAAGLIATSRNGLRGAIKSDLPVSFYKKPLFVVGEASAQLALSLGFLDVRWPENSKGVRDLIPLLKKYKKQLGQETNPFFVQVCGDQMAFDLALHQETLGRFEPITTYHMVELTQFSQQCLDVIRAGKLRQVLLMSPRTAKIFSRLVRRAKVHQYLTQVDYICLSEAVAKELDLEIAKDVKIAAVPSLNSVLDLL